MRAPSSPSPPGTPQPDANANNPPEINHHPYPVVHVSDPYNQNDVDFTVKREKIIEKKLSIEKLLNSDRIVP